MPDSLELPGVRRAVVPLVSAGHAVVHELVAHGLPRLAAVARALNLLPEPAAGLRRIESIRIDGRSLQMVDLPAGEVRTADLPLFTLAVRCHDERALPCANQNSYSAHGSFLSEISNDCWRPTRVLDLFTIPQSIGLVTAVSLSFIRAFPRSGGGHCTGPIRSSASRPWPRCRGWPGPLQNPIPPFYPCP